MKKIILTTILAVLPNIVTYYATDWLNQKRAVSDAEEREGMVGVVKDLSHALSMCNK